MFVSAVVIEVNLRIQTIIPKVITSNLPDVGYVLIVLNSGIMNHQGCAQEERVSVWQYNIVKNDNVTRGQNDHIK